MWQFCSMVKVQINSDHYLIPEKWDELTTDQLLKIAEYVNSQLPFNEFRIKLMMFFLGLHCMRIEERTIKGEVCFFFRQGKKNIYALSAIDLSCLLSRIDFIFKISKADDDSNQKVVHSHLCRQLIPAIKVSGTEYIGPASSLTNLLFHEYIFTETYFYKFSETKEIKYADLLIAVLYRENSGKNENDADYNGDPRIQFNDFHLDARAEKIAKLDPAFKTAILFFYDGCRNYLRVKFKEVFESSSGKNQKVDPFANFMKLVTTLTNNDITKNDQVRKSYLYEVMIALQEMVIQNNKQKEELEKLKKKSNGR